MISSEKIMLLAASMALSGSCVAAVSGEEAKQLNGPVLTTWGAEKNGNQDGSIPAYSGERIKVPAKYDPKNPGQHPDPFQDKPLFTITAQNYTQHASRLSEGQKALFKTYPEFRMNVYPTRRTASFPKYVLENTLRNATSCKAVDNETRLDGCYGGLPFPIPKSGNQVMWNHLATFEGQAWTSKNVSYLVPTTGAPVLQVLAETTNGSPYYDPANKEPLGPNATYWKIRVDDLAPVRRVGGKLVLIDALDQISIGRRAWQYIPGQRRVKLAPDLAYDTPAPYTGGISTMDDARGYSGRLDRFNWQLMGKKETFILYNAFALQDHETCPEEKLHGTRNFPNPDCLRWELHRTWQVTGTLKPGFRHMYAKRTLYWDEDGYAAGSTEAFDATGKLVRVQWMMNNPLYEAVGSTSPGSLYMDLQTGAWASNGAGSCAGCGNWLSKPKDDYHFTPEALAGEGVR